MRAAHSLKGAARIVGLDAAVRVAHALEDNFVAAQRGEFSIRSPDVDVLLRAVDLLARIAQLPEEGGLLAVGERGPDRGDGRRAWKVCGREVALSRGSDVAGGPLSPTLPHEGGGSQTIEEAGSIAPEPPSRPPPPSWGRAGARGRQRPPSKPIRSRGRSRFRRRPRPPGEWSG